MPPARIAILVALVALAIAAVWFVIWLRTELRIDRCLDLGGRWNYEQAACEGARSEERTEWARATE